eukprot:TRINITY_DN3867_c0_g7_i1.p1 TRINITY_DN3867_c0_g7~~TRINITY_DN3867_c0_g7_i1.p1  ORF type:complete len:439 (+),score=13.32 TRINITY_DN3867_c0_g7_i1:364-1680(+)
MQIFKSLCSQNSQLFGTDKNLNFQQILWKSSMKEGINILLAQQIFYAVKLGANVALEYVKRKIITQVEIDEQESVFDWIKHWMQYSDIVKQSQRFCVECDAYQLQQGCLSWNESLKFTPQLGSYIVQFRGQWIYINYIESVQRTFRGDCAQQKLKLTYFGRSQELIKQLIKEAHDLYKSSRIGMTIVNIVNQQGDWYEMDAKPIRQLNTIVLPKNTTNNILHDCQNFLNNRKWYQKLGIPYRRGYLLYGKPGAGKSSLVTAIAGSLHLEIYVISLSSPKMNDQTLLQLISQIRSGSILLLEDIDAAFVDRQQADDKVNQLSFSGLLNAIDGVTAQEGNLMFMTTNHIELLDPALIRPGRVDVRVEFSCATAEQMQEYFLRFYRAYETETNLVQPAQEFARALSNVQLCIADIQGHLIKYKKDFVGAVENVQDLLLTLK